MKNNGKIKFFNKKNIEKLKKENFKKNTEI